MIRPGWAWPPLVLVALAVLAAPASAHVEIDPAEASASSVVTLEFVVEPEGAATTGLVVQLPEGARVLAVPVKAGTWVSSVDAAANTVTWSGGSSPAVERFRAKVQLPPTVGEVRFPTLQQTSAGEIAWSDAKESDGERGYPSPRITLTAAPDNPLPGTTLEAAERDDGTTSAAPWVIGSGIAAVLVIAVGGTLLQRKQRNDP